MDGSVGDGATVARRRDGSARARHAAHSSHSTTVPSIWKKGSPTEVCQFWGDLRIRLLSVSRIFVWPWHGEGVSKETFVGRWIEQWTVWAWRSHSVLRMRLGSGLRTAKTVA